MPLQISPPRTVSPVRDSQIGTASAILNQLLTAANPRCGYAIRLWTGETITSPGESPSPFTLVIRRPGALRRFFWPPGDLGVAEAFLDGDLEIEGDIVAAVSFGEELLEAALRPSMLLALLPDIFTLKDAHQNGASGDRPPHLAGSLHSPARDRRAIHCHYDVGNEFYALWLDPRLVYSCAYFRTGTETLEQAQAAKLDLICRKLRLRAGESLLDIGCGWGGLALFAAERYGVQALGITLSDRQYQCANERIRSAGQQGRVRVELCDYRAFSEGQFDKIASVGMFEHVGRARMEEYFASAYRLLKPGGLFLNHAIADRKCQTLLGRLAAHLQTESFINRYVFPDGELVPIHTALQLAEGAGFEVRNVESLRRHYSRTLRQWLRRLEGRREEALKTVDERTYRIWRLYLAGSAHGFDTGWINVYQSLLRKEGGGAAPEPPWTPARWYA